MSQSKIFGIGLAKTGTTSLNAALRILGYSAVDYPLGLKGVEDHDAATDMPIADSFELLDRKYPGSKFIYTIRPRDDWLRSCQTHWAKWHASEQEMQETRPEVADLFRRLYGTVEFDAVLFSGAYDRHEARVLRYFADRPNDLLIIDICSGKSGWKSLCSFLGKEMPNLPFPHENKRKNWFEKYLERNRIAKRIWKKAGRKMEKAIRSITHLRQTR